MLAVTKRIARHGVRSLNSQERSVGEFARIVKFKVNSVEHGQAIDKHIAENLLPMVSKMDGLVSMQRLLCGGELDYMLLTQWRDVESLKASEAEKEDLLKVFSAATDAPITDLHLQNFMHKQVL